MPAGPPQTRHTPAKNPRLDPYSMTPLIPEAVDHPYGGAQQHAPHLIDQREHGDEAPPPQPPLFGKVGAYDGHQKQRLHGDVAVRPGKRHHIGLAVAPITAQYGTHGVGQHQPPDEEGKNGECLGALPPVQLFWVGHGPNPRPKPPELGQHLPLTMAPSHRLGDQDGHADPPQCGALRCECSPIRPIEKWPRSR